MRNFSALTSLAPAALAVALAMLAGSAIARDPTAEEQYWLELVNQARRDPAGELERLTNYSSPTTFAGVASDNADVAVSLAAFGTDAATLAAQWSTLQAAAPLAWNSSLAATSLSYSNLMVTSDAQSHTLDGFTESQLDLRLTNTGSYGLDWLDLGENLYASSLSIFHGHAGFLIDWGDENGDGIPGYGTGIQAPPDHRINTLLPRFKEIGIGIATTSIPVTNSQATGPYAVTQHFGNQYVQRGADYYSDAIATGVIYSDALLGDHFYTPGEGFGGVRVDVFVNGSVAPAFSSFTNSAGGFNIALPGLIAGDLIRIEAIGTGEAPLEFTLGSTSQVYGSTTVTFYNNVYASFISSTPEPSGALLLLLAGGLLGQRRQRLRL